ncbi:MAG: MBOAT family protein [Lachnospiraceae bacterium]|nr:MBOAT family protein [Lachnospiraceae bacterium]
MLFNSFAFAIFLPIVFILYWALPKKCQWLVILVSSYYFYMSWNVKYVVLILMTTVVSYITAILLEKEHNEKKRKLYLSVAFLFCLGVLFFFKYFNFISASIAGVVQRFSIQYSPFMVDVLLPVGISFYTFQTLAYVIDVYRGDVNAEHHFGKYAAFISFFPQLVAGPIERTANLLPQIKRENIFEYGQASYGLKLMVWGFFKKIVIADTLAVYVDTVYNNLHEYTGMILGIATIFFTIQIYCDFSGYSDIAVGCAKLFGIDLMSNFKSPYFSSSVKEFWSRWHISLSTWFRDYVYIPLGGNRVSKWRHRLNLMITFLVSGLWHGAAWTYVIWGGIHGLAQVMENLFGKIKVRKGKGVRMLLVFLFAAFAWIFFRAQSFSDAAYVIRYTLSGIRHPRQYLMAGYQDLALTKKAIMTCIGMIGLLCVYDAFSLKYDVIACVGRWNVVLRWTVYLAMVLLILFMAPIGNASSFIYFQF